MKYGMKILVSWCVVGCIILRAADQPSKLLYLQQPHERVRLEQEQKLTANERAQRDVRFFPQNVSEKVQGIICSYAWPLIVSIKGVNAPTLLKWKDEDSRLVVSDGATYVAVWDTKKDKLLDMVEADFRVVKNYETHSSDVYANPPLMLLEKFPNQEKVKRDDGQSFSYEFVFGEGIIVEGMGSIPNTEYSFPNIGAFHGNGDFFAVSPNGSNIIEIWRTATRTRFEKLNQLQKWPGSSITALAWNERSNSIAAGFKDGIAIWGLSPSQHIVRMLRKAHQEANIEVMCDMFKLLSAGNTVQNSPTLKNLSEEYPTFYKRAVALWEQKPVDSSNYKIEAADIRGAYRYLRNSNSDNIKVFENLIICRPNEYPGRLKHAQELYKKGREAESN